MLLLALGAICLQVAHVVPAEATDDEVFQNMEQRYRDFRYVECYSGSTGQNVIARYIVATFYWQNLGSVVPGGEDTQALYVVANLGRVKIVKDPASSTRQFKQVTPVISKNLTAIVDMQCGSKLVAKLNQGPLRSTTLNDWRREIANVTKHGQVPEFISEAKFNSLEVNQ